MTSRLTRQRLNHFTAVLATLLLIEASACSRPDPEAHLQSGDRFVADGQLREATIEYRAALQADPNRGDIRVKLGETYLQLGEPASALGEYVRAADLMPDNAEVQRKAGGLLLLVGRFSDAKARVDRALQIAPNDVEAQILLGNTLAGLMDVDGALREYQLALALDPTADVAYRNMATLQASRGQQREAEAAFRKAIDVAPSSVPARLSLASFLWANDRAPEAEDTLKGALTLDPANLTANQALGTFYLGSGRAPEAEPYFKAMAATANTSQARLSLADYYLFTKRFDEARALLNEVANDKEAFAPSMIRLAALDVALGVRAQAHDKLRQVLERHPKDMAARLFTARLFVMDGKRDDALSMAESIVKDEPNSSTASAAFQVIGAMQASFDRPEEAIKAFEQVIRRQPGAVEAKMSLARLHLLRGELDASETHLRDVLSAAPSNPAARAEMIRVLLARGDGGRARTELTSLQKEFPTAVPVMKLVALQHLSERRIPAARAAFEKVASVAPNDLEALQGIVQIDLQTGRTREALETVDRALKAIPASGDLYTLAAQAYAKSGDQTKAEELLKRAIETDPTRLQAYGLLGMLYASQNRLSEAEQHFKESAARNPASVSNGTMLAMVYDAQRRTADAEKEYRRVLSLDREAAVAANNLAWIYAVSGRSAAESLELARVAQRRLPDNPDVNDTLGFVYLKQGQFALAIKHLEASAAKAPDLATTHYHLGLAYLGFGEREKARASLTRAVSSKTPFDGLDDARKKLAEVGE